MYVWMYQFGLATWLMSILQVQHCVVLGSAVPLIQSTTCWDFRFRCNVRLQVAQCSISCPMAGSFPTFLHRSNLAPVQRLALPLCVPPSVTCFMLRISLVNSHGHQSDPISRHFYIHLLSYLHRQAPASPQVEQVLATCLAQEGQHVLMSP